MLCLVAQWTEVTWIWSSRIAANAATQGKQIRSEMNSKKFYIRKNFPPYFLIEKFRLLNSVYVKCVTLPQKCYISVALGLPHFHLPLQLETKTFSSDLAVIFFAFYSIFFCTSLTFVFSVSERFLYRSRQCSRYLFFSS